MLRNVAKFFRVLVKDSIVLVVEEIVTHFSLFDLSNELDFVGNLV